MVKISDQISWFQSGLWQLNSVHLHHLDTSCVIDPGYTHSEIQYILGKVMDPAWKNKFLLYTHGDYDHIIGTNYFDGFIQVGSQAMANRADKNRILNQIQSFDQEQYIERPYPIQYPMLDICFDPNAMVETKIGSVLIHIFNAGGHTADGLFYVFPELNLFVAGDYLSDIEFPFIEDSILAYRNTLETAQKIIESYPIDFMIPGHGSVAFTTSEISRRITASQAYLESIESNDGRDWRKSWGSSAFGIYLDGMHEKNKSYGGS